MERPILRGALAVTALFVASFAASTAHADQLPVTRVLQMCANGYVGPRTAYGETKSEAANKKIVYSWTCMALAEGKADQAFDQYVSKDFCDHSHMINAGLKDCADFSETKKMFERLGSMAKPGGSIEFPIAATVNGELVTQWGAGADIWRVHNGKITDHWDASPPVTITMTAHDGVFSDRMQAQIDSGKRIQGVGIPGGAPAPQ